MMYLVLGALLAFFAYAMVRYYADAAGVTKWEKILAAMSAAGAGVWAWAQGLFS
jgi:hypothetical protein